MSEISLPLSRPTLGEEEIREIIEVIRSGWITSGPRINVLKRSLPATLAHGTRSPSTHARPRFIWRCWHTASALEMKS
jgi:hypothetical protein